jgi:hypothetical protein
MLAALDRVGDQTPCSFMLFNGLKEKCSSYLEFLEKQISLGLDTYVQIPPRPPVVINDTYNLHGLPVSFDPAVEVREWIERPDSERWPVMAKEYHTPLGTLRAEVHQDDEWRWGDHVPFLDDFLETRSKKFIITKPEDLRSLEYLLVSPTESEIAEFKEVSQRYVEFANKNELLLAGGWGIGADMLAWIFGLEKMIYAIYDTPVFIHDLLGIIFRWNQARMKVVLGAGVDLYIKRAWYENCDFWSPKSYREFLYPILKADVDLAHTHGARFGYIITSNCMPLLDMFVEAGVDVLIGVDPRAWDLNETSRKLGGKICLWGGVNGHLTVEEGSSAQVRSEVRYAMKTLACSRGFILSPVDNIRQYTERVQRNTSALIDEWRRRG